MNKKKTAFITAAVFALLFILTALLVKTVDVSAIGPDGTSIGLSSVNGPVRDFFGTSELWYKLTEWLGYAAILIAVTFFVMGVYQLISRKSIFKVDPEIICLGIIYVLTIAFYLFFEVFPVNFRPALMPGETVAEASFPSSHTVLACVILGTAIILVGKYFRGNTLKTVLTTAMCALIGLIVSGRFISGAHWLTDIIAGMLLSAALIALFAGLLEIIRSVWASRKN